MQKKEINFKSNRVFGTALLCCFFVLAAFVLMPRSFAANAQGYFQQANNSYKSGKFDDAAALYEKAILENSFQVYPELHFNLANSKFRSGNIFEAIYHYERALALNPWYADARFNLNAAKAKIEYKIEDRRNMFIRFNDLCLKWVKTSQMGVIALIFSLLFFTACGVWLKNSAYAPFWSFPRLECFFLLLFFCTLLGAKIFYTQHYGEAIVLTNEAEVRYGPSVDNQSVMKLGGGLKVFIVDSREDWSRVLAWNGETGWMRNSELGRIDQ